MENQKPSVGRIVHYHDHHGGPFAAIVTTVHSDTCVDIVVFDGSGAWARRHVNQARGTGDSSGNWCWPPYVKQPAEIKLTQIGDARFENPAGAAVSPISAPPIGGLVPEPEKKPDDAQ